VNEFSFAARCADHILQISPKLNNKCEKYGYEFISDPSKLRP